MNPALNVATLGVVTVLTGASASAAIVTTSSVERFEHPTNVGNYTEISEFTPTSELDGGSLNFGMTGDLRMEFEPGQHGTAFRHATIGGAQSFEVNGPFPMQMTLSADLNFKVAHAGGPVDTPYGDGYAVAELRVFETGSYLNGDATLAGLGQQVGRIGDGSPDLAGNGFAIVDLERTASDSYLLAPGVSYTAIWWLRMYNTTDHLAPNDPYAAVFYEAGGISGFSGLNFSLNAVAVPAPGGVALLACAGLCGARRRRGV